MEASAIENSVERNQHGGWYQSGKEFSTEKKTECEETYRDLCSKNGGPPSISAFAREIKTSRGFARKIMKEIQSRGHVVSVDTLKEERKEENQHVRGVGAFSIPPHVGQILLDLRRTDPSRSNISYVAMLQQMTGESISASLVSKFFKEIGPYSAKQRKTSMILIDKYHRRNIKAYQDYLNYVSEIPIHKLKFGDEKIIKGQELWSRKVWPDPFTGLSPPGIVVPSDFRNTYCVMGLCSVDRRSQPFIFSIGQNNSDSAAFMAMIRRAIVCGWLKCGDFLILDNARVHSGGEADILQDLLWNGTSPINGQQLKIFIIPFPTRSLELNPIELLWNILVMRLKTIPAHTQLYRGKGVKVAAIDIMQKFTHEDVLKCFNKGGYY